MTGIISKKHVFEFATELALTPIVCFFADKKYPFANRMHLLAFSIAYMVIRRSLFILAHNAAQALTVKAGYVNEERQTTNLKFYYLEGSVTSFILMSLLLSYSSIGQRFNLQFPNLFETSGFLAFNIGISMCVIDTSYAFIPSLANSK